MKISPHYERINETNKMLYNNNSLLLAHMSLNDLFVDILSKANTMSDGICKIELLNILYSGASDFSSRVRYNRLVV